jgi:hypothetical protein
MFGAVKAAVSAAHEVDVLTRAVVLILTLAPGIERPSASTTVPDNVVKILPCAYAETPIVRISANARNTRPRLVLEPLITNLLQFNTQTKTTTSECNGAVAFRQYKRGIHPGFGRNLPG